MTPETLEQIAKRMVIDILLEKTETYWLKRAKDFGAVGTPDCDEIARACRNKAVLCRQETREDFEALMAIELGDAA